MLLLSLFCWFFADGPPLDWHSWDADHYTVVPIDGVASPTSLRPAGDTWLVCADLLEAQPGLFEMVFDEHGSAQAQRLLTLPSLDLRGMAVRQDRAVFLVAANDFSPSPSQWRSLLVSVDATERRLGESKLLDQGNTCFDGRPECGIVSVLFLRDGHLLALRAADHPSLILMKHTGTRWEPVIHHVLFANRRLAHPVDIQVFGEDLIILFRDQWVLARLPLAEATAMSSQSLHAEPVFDFGHLQNTITTSNQQLLALGLAEAFALDTNGDLLILLNNRGFPFVKSPDGVLDRRAKIVRFSNQGGPWVEK